MITQRILLGIAWLTLGVILFFFLWGLSDGTVGAFNILPWLGLVAVPSLMLWAARALRAKGRHGAATAVLGVMAVPAVLVGVVILIFIIAPPSFH